MPTMADLFASGRIIDAILVLVILEAAALLALQRLTGRGPPGLALLANLAAGAFLLVALRLTIAGQDWPLVALALAAGLVAHLADLAQRLRAGR